MTQPTDKIPERLGKVPPQNIDLEEAVLGACMLEKPAFGKVRDLLVPEDFYKPAHEEIFQSLIDLFNESTPIDLLIVTNKLRSTGKLEVCGGMYYLTELTTKVSSAAHIEEHAFIIKQSSIKRQIINLSSVLHITAYEETEDPFDIVEKAQKELNDITKFSGGTKDVPLYELLHNKVVDIQNVMKGEKPAVGLPTGFLNLDKVLGAWMPGDLIILAARPGMGKSAKALRLCLNQAIMFGVPAALISLEMSKESLIDRLIAMESEIYLGDIRFCKINSDQLERIIDKSGEMSDIPLFLVDYCYSLQQIRSKARRLVEENGVRLIIIDYLQLIIAGAIESRKSSNRENEISYISRELKILAKELGIPIIALSQLSRAVETRGGDKRPKLSDLRESGAIEQDADEVIFLYRPEYYGITQDQNGEPLVSGYTEAIIAKNRNGPIDMAELIFHGFKTDFSNYNEFDEKVSQKTPF